LIQVLSKTRDRLTVSVYGQGMVRCGNAASARQRAKVVTLMSIFERGKR